MDLVHAQEVWGEWEIHCLILMSLSLQVFLSLAADLRRRSASCVLSTVLWLAYLSADTVAIFVLGHLAVHVEEPSYELMLFWAPFVLVHLGGQDTITAFSKQDNELWTRHLLGLVTQTAVAGYVVSMSSWPDARLKAAMVLLFLCGFLKYSGRTFCLFSASPKSLRAESIGSLLNMLSHLKKAQIEAMKQLGEWRNVQVEPEAWRNVQVEATKPIFEPEAWRKEVIKKRFELMFRGADRYWEFVNELDPTSPVDDIMLVDTPVDDVMMTMVADEVPDMLKDFKDKADRCIVYKYVAACLVESYQVLYTKAPLIVTFFLFLDVFTVNLSKNLAGSLIDIPVLLTYTLFQCISTVIALVLFASAQKEGHYRKADITVSYILLVGAIVLDLLPACSSIVSCVRKPFRPKTEDECTLMIGKSCLRPHGWHTRKHWSEELAQYNMIGRYNTGGVGDYNGSMPFIRKWIVKCKPLLGASCDKFLDITCTPVTDNLKLFVLDKLLQQASTREWHLANFRGERALQKWMGSRHQVQGPEWSGYDALHSSLTSRVDFPTSVLIWHIATDICYFSVDNGNDAQNDETTMNTTKMTKKKKKKKMMMLSMELSQYIMYLVFKCDVMLTSNSRLVHKKAHEELVRYLPGFPADAKENVKVMFEAMKKEATKKEEQQQDSAPPKMARDNSDDEPADKNGPSTSSKSGMLELLKSMEEAIYLPVLPRAFSVAQELICINDEADRWELISEVWLEMFFYTAPRCGAAFHYEHLSTGGEFITHVLFLMRLLGPFMPKPGA